MLLPALFTLWGIPAVGAETLSLSQALDKAFQNNPELAAARAKADAEHAAIRSEASLDNPMFGLQYEQNLNLMEMQGGPMRLWSVTQDVKFPTKYFLLGKAQSARASQADREAAALKLEIRKKTVAAYYRAFTVQRILELLQANLESARKTSRTAETRYSTGAVPQQDEIKAHTEETRINSEILMTEEEAEAAKNDLASLLAQNVTSVQLPTSELHAPKMTVPGEEIPELAGRHARHIKHFEEMVSEAESKKTLAMMNYLPDFRLDYRHAYSGAPEDAYAFSIEATIPLWFFLKQGPEVSRAKAELAQAERSLDRLKLDTESQVRTLARKARNHQTLLRIYETTLIPQATATLNSSEAAYRAGKVNLLELLDSQRALFQTRIAYYRTLAEYAESLSELESITGTSLSDLPFPMENHS